MTTSPMDGLEDDPRCQPGAYIQMHGKYLYQVLWVANGVARVEDCRNPDNELYLIPENIRRCVLVRAAASVPVIEIRLETA